MTKRLTNLLGIQHPVIQAPMAGGTTPPELIAAASNAGALGSLGAAYMSPSDIEANVDEIRKLTDKPIAVNLFTYAPPTINQFDDEKVNRLTNVIGKYCAELGTPKPTRDTASSKFSIDQQLEVVISKGVSILSFAFGIPTEKQLKILKDKKIVLIGTATTVTEARMLEDAGIDVVVAQGSEAGGHRGTFEGSFDAAMIGSMSLIPQVVDAVDVPVIAAGGIMDARGVAAALALGADGVQMGTAFLLCDEANVQPGYKQAILEHEPEDTKITIAFSGRPARGIKNRFMTEMENNEETILPFPLTDSMTKPMRAAARSQGLIEYINMWCGQSGRLGNQMPVAKLIETVSRGSKEVLASTLSSFD